MLRVAYLFERFPSFGQTFCYREVAELVRQGAEVSVFSIRHPSDEPQQDWDEAIVGAITYLPEEAALLEEVEKARRSDALPEEAVRALRDWGRQTDFLRLYQAAFIGRRLRAAGIDRVHAHFAGMAARTAYWIKQFFGTQFAFTAHANDIFAPREFAISLEKLMDAADGIVTVSDFAVERLRKQFPQSAGKIHRVYNGLALDGFRIADFAAPVPLILSVGRLIEKKGFGHLISACAQLRGRGLDFHCEIVGEGSLEATLSAQIADARLGDRVKLLGPRTQHQIVDRLAAATVFVLPCVTDPKGDMDNLPTVIMEAMAAGLPVISTSVAGVPEMVYPGTTGALVAQADPVALADAISEVISQPALAKQLGRAGRELVVEKFSIETNVRALAEILRSAIARS